MSNTAPAARHLTAWDTDKAARSARHDAGVSHEEAAMCVTHAAVAGAYALLAAEQSVTVEHLQTVPAELLDPPADVPSRLSQRDAARALADLRALGLA